MCCFYRVFPLCQCENNFYFDFTRHSKRCQHSIQLAPRLLRCVAFAQISCSELISQLVLLKVFPPLHIFNSTHLLSATELVPLINHLVEFVTKHLILERTFLAIKGQFFLKSLFHQLCQIHFAFLYEKSLVTLLLNCFILVLKSNLLQLYTAFELLSKARSF